jgi:hypothetical protein
MRNSIGAHLNRNTQELGEVVAQLFAQVESDYYLKMKQLYTLSMMEREEYRALFAEKKIELRFLLPPVYPNVRRVGEGFI